MAQVRVMTWNVENLFLPGDDAGPDTQATFDRKIASLAAVIDAQAPHVLALQEVGPPEALEHLLGALTHHLPHAELGDPDGRGIRVALLSTRPLANRTRVRTLPVQVRPVQVRDPVWGDDAVTDQMGRGALAATVTIDGTPVTVVTAHFKSKLISYPRQAGVVTGSQWQPNDEGERLRYAGYAVNLRTAEAMTIRAHLDGLLHNPADPDDGTGSSTRTTSPRPAPHWSPTPCRRLTTGPPTVATNPAPTTPPPSRCSTSERRVFPGS